MEDTRKYIEINEEDLSIISIAYYPFHSEYGMNKTEEELLQTGYLVDEIPDQPTESIGDDYSWKMFYNTETNSCYWDKIKNEVIPQLPTEVELLDERVTLLEDTVAEVILTFSDETAPISLMSLETETTPRSTLSAGSAQSKFLANMIYRGKLDYDTVISKRPDLKEDIDAYLEELGWVNN